METVNCKGQCEGKSLADLIFQLSQAIWYVAILDSSNAVIECKGQATFAPPLSPETLTDFVELGPLLVLGAFGHKLEPSCGRIGYAAGRFEKALVVIYQLSSHMVVLVMDSIASTQQLDEIASFLKKMEKSFTDSTSHG